QHRRLPRVRIHSFGADKRTPLWQKAHENLKKGRYLRSFWPAGTHRVLIGFVQSLCAFFRQLKELRGKSYYAIRVVLLNPVPIAARNFVFACTRCNAENNPPICLKLRARLRTLSLALSLRLAFLLFLAST